VFFYLWVVSKIWVATLFCVGGETVALILLLVNYTTLLSLLGAVFLISVMTCNDSVTMLNWLSCYKVTQTIHYQDCQPLTSSN
jgi:hypothetical protein